MSISNIDALGKFAFFKLTEDRVVDIATTKNLTTKELGENYNH